MLESTAQAGFTQGKSNQPYDRYQRVGLAEPIALVQKRMLPENPRVANKSSRKNDALVVFSQQYNELQRSRCPMFLYLHRPAWSGDPLI